MTVSQARAIRRRSAARREVEHVHNAYAWGIENAIKLNHDNPIPGLAPVLYEIRAEYGPDCVVALCPECCGVGVVS